MEKKVVERELKSARWGILLLGILSWGLMVFSEYGDKEFRFSLIAIIVSFTIFMYAVITFLLKYATDK